MGSYSVYKTAYNCSLKNSYNVRLPSEVNTRLLAMCSTDGTCLVFGGQENMAQANIPVPGACVLEYKDK